MRVLTILLVLLSTPLVANEVVVDDTMDFSFQPPTTRMDGSPLSLDEIDGYDLSCAGRNIWITPEEAEGGYRAQTSEVLPDYGQYVCKISTVDTDGLASQWSNEVLVSWPEPEIGTPRAPTDLGTEF